MNENFSAELKSLGIRHEFKMLVGSHSLEVVQEAITSVISFINNEYSKKGNNATESRTWSYLQHA